MHALHVLYSLLTLLYWWEHKTVKYAKPYRHLFFQVVFHNTCTLKSRPIPLYRDKGHILLRTLTLIHLTGKYCNGYQKVRWKKLHLWMEQWCTFQDITSTHSSPHTQSYTRWLEHGWLLLQGRPDPHCQASLNSRRQKYSSHFRHPQPCCWKVWHKRKHKSHWVCWLDISL